MGTNHSHCPKNKRDGHGISNSLPPGKTIPARGKPKPPSQPMVTDVTHNSVSLSWQPPHRHTGDTVFAYTIEVTTPADLKHWRVVSKCCQGNSYQVRNLEAGCQYLFRVHAENIHGLSKASRPSQVVETKMFGVDQQGFVPAPEDRVRSLPRHQPSISLHLEGSITALLNHTDITVTTNTRDFRRSGKIEDEEEDGSLSKSDRGNCDTLDGRQNRGASLQREVTSSSSLQSERTTSCLQRDASGRLSLQPDRWKSNSLQRDAHQRSSLQPTRKRSLPILLPGTRTDSLNKLRDSQTFPVTSKKLMDAVDSRRRGPNLRERSASDVDSNGSGSREDVVKIETADLKPPKRDSGLEEDAENPWERDDSASEVSEGVVSAHEDRKDSLSPSPPDSTGWLGVNSGNESCQTDFRMLRRVLHSDDVIVKPLSDMGCRRASPHNALSTIVDLEEEEDSVRVTTL